MPCQLFAAELHTCVLLFHSSVQECIQLVLCNMNSLLCTVCMGHPQCSTQALAIHTARPGSCAAPPLYFAEPNDSVRPQWRYSEFLEAVENNKVERAIFNKDGDVLQALAEGRRALVILPKDPQLLDTLMKHGVDFQGESSSLQAFHISCSSVFHEQKRTRDGIGVHM